MARFAAWETEGHPNEAVRRFLAALLERGVVQAILVPARQLGSHVVMQTLIADASRMDRAEPLAPVAWKNAGALAAALTMKPTGAPLAAVLRSCEVRAFVELTKLNQATRHDLLLIGVDCFGRFENRDYLRLAKQEPSFANHFLKHACESGGASAGQGIAQACRACEFPEAPSVDLRLCLFGEDVMQAVRLEAASERGEAALAAVGLTVEQQESGARAAALKAIMEQRLMCRDALFAAFEQRSQGAEGLAQVTAGCINCFNCRVACPVCYCRACVFTTDLFQHDSAKYLQWSKKRGMLRMPTDTAFYHLTRMVHMSTLCVGCGQCSSACPNDIPVMEMFRTVAQAAQKRFAYVPGRDFGEPQPLATFHEDELPDATGSLR